MKTPIDNRNESHPGIPYAWTLGVVLVTTVVCFAFRSRVNPTSIAMVLLLAVVFVASRFDRGPAVVASVLAIAIFDFMFIPPYYTFNVHDRSYFVTFAVMLVVALSMSRLTATIRDQAREAREDAARTAAVFALSQELAEAKNATSILEIAARHTGKAARGKATIVVADGTNPENVFEELEVRVAAGWALQHGEAAGAGTRRCAASEAILVPLRGSRILGVMAVQPEPPGRKASSADSKTAQAFADQAALALELGSQAVRRG